MKSFGEVIRERRTELGMSQAALSELVGVRPATIARYELGTIKNIKRDNMLRIADALSINASDLVDGSNYAPPTQTDLDRVCVVLRKLHILSEDGSVDFKRLTAFEQIVLGVEKMWK
jgi:transcriptional regulator with XRE-family HTH domain